MQGHHVTIRQLLDHTSGIVDYHYLGDPIEATSRQPKALDEVMALYAGKKWVNEPGAKWDWSISGFQLLVTIVERVSGQSFAEYVQRNLFEPAGLSTRRYCDDYTLVHGLSHAYRRFENGFVPANENDMAYNADLRICSTVGDFYKLWTALASHKLLRAESFTMMHDARGRGRAHERERSAGAVRPRADDQSRRRPSPLRPARVAVRLQREPVRVSRDHLTIVVLTNTEGQNAYAITRALSRQILGLPALPSAPRAAPRRHRVRSTTSPSRRRSGGNSTGRSCSRPIAWRRTCTTRSRNTGAPFACSTRTAG